jgi:uncharacterized protein YndB with AHSA1/START domain
MTPFSMTRNADMTGPDTVPARISATTQSSLMPPRVKLGTGRRQGRGLVCSGNCRAPAARLPLSAVGWESWVMNERAGGLVLELKLVLGAPRERIFRALTEPAELAKWWGPHGFTTPGIDLDLRVGGGYRFTMQPPGGDRFHLSGEFLEIAPPGRLVYTFRWDEPDPDDRETVVALSLGDVADATQVSLSQGEFATEARLALHRGGWTDSLEKLRELIEPGA